MPQSISVRQPQQITFTSTPPADATFDGGSYTVTATGGGSMNPLLFAVDGSASGVCSINGTVVSFTGVGTCLIDANQSGSSLYVDAPQVQQSFAVAPAAQTVTFTSTAPAGAVYGGAPYTVSATGGGSGNPVSFSIDPSATAVCSISGAAVSFVGVGTCVVDANQLASADYSAATETQQSFSVGRAPQSITFISVPPSGATVGGPSGFVSAYGGASGNPVQLSIDPSAAEVCSIAGSTVSFSDAGTCVVDAEQAGNADFLAAPEAQQSFQVSWGGPLAQTIAFTSAAPTYATVGGASYTVTATGGGSGNAVTFGIDASAAAVCSISDSVVSFTATGTCVIDANQAGNTHYLAATQTQQSFAVYPTPTAPASVSVAGPAVVDAGADYAANAVAAGASPAPAFSLAAGAPGWLSVDPSTGKVSGTVAAGITSLSYAVIATNQVGSATSPLQTVTVDFAPASVQVSGPDSVVVGTNYASTASASSANPAVAYSLEAGAPGWLSVNATTGVVSGTVPEGITSFAFRVTATNSVGSATSTTETVTVKEGTTSLALAPAPPPPVPVNSTVTYTAKISQTSGAGALSGTVSSPTTRHRWPAARTSPSLMAAPRAR